MSATILWRTTSDPLQPHEGEVVDPVERVLEAGQAALAVRYVDLGGITGDDDTRAEPDAGEEHLHLFG